MNINSILSIIPDGLRLPLVKEYNNILQHYLERRWTASELSGGKFCEIVFTILDGYAKGTYESSPFKPSNFVDACKKLENNAGVPRSFQILIPRMLPALYEIRNNRNVGHVGGDVDPNLMDAQAVTSMCSWVMGELIRVLHNIPVSQAQSMVDSISSRKMPLVWTIGDVKRVLNPSTSLKDQILLLIGVDSTQTNIDDLFRWIEYKNKAYFLNTLRSLHRSRLIELSTDGKFVEILPPGSIYIEGLVVKINK
ncbi:hypothetical protein [Mucilaginibacter sp.]|uniref:hypothetical protein n=1 Tax=Mucilaginibacter sp. TaxID=1882438 RepID=UPI002615B07D|nr:hypothetical protein [Mucilaginibacter sp.]MDB4919500.1 hypothetical protein [Mucilaginibacter sp.]